MEITNKIKAKVFAQYFGQSIVGKDKDGILIDNHFSGSFLNDDEILNNMQLWLKPLSEITDEDAIELAKLFDDDIDESDIDTLIELGKDVVGYEVFSFDIYQLLQSKGYDIPQYLLGNKTLHECGLAIYENEI